MTPERIRKSNKEKMVFGVAGGLAEYFDVDPVLVRLAFVLGTFASGVGLITYIVMAFLMPHQESSAAHTADVVKENWQSIGQDAAEAAHRAKEAVQGTPSADEGLGTPGPSTGHVERSRNHASLGLLLIILGVMFFLANLGAFWWFRWGAFWPVLLIVIGVAVIIGRVRRT